MDFPSHQNQALKTCMVAAKKNYSLSPLSPCFKRWLNEMVSVAKMEEIRFSKWNSQNYSQRVWKLLLALLDETYPYSSWALLLCCILLYLVQTLRHPDSLIFWQSATHLFVLSVFLSVRLFYDWFMFVRFLLSHPWFSWRKSGESHFANIVVNWHLWTNTGSSIFFCYFM